MSNSPFLQDSTWGAFIQEASISTKCFASTFLPSQFGRAFAPQTDALFRAIDDPALQKVLIVAHRGLGKTTIVNRAYPARHICYRSKRFIVTVSNTAAKAVMDAASLRNALVTNDTTSGDIIPVVFGDLKGETWGAQHFLAGDTYVLPRGAGQQIRGLNYNGRRPDLIIVDDLEDPEAVLSEERREKLKQWFFADLMNSVDRARKDWKIVVIGTLLHEAALLADLLKDPTWTKVMLPLCDDNLRSYWPEFMLDEAIEELFQSFLAQGQADTFAREYQNKPISNVDAVFKPEFFRYYEPKELLDNKDVYFVTIVDPAKTVKLHSADSAIVTLGIDLTNHNIFFHDCVAGKLHPDELFNKMFEQVVAHNSRILAVEVTSLNEFITQPIKNEMSKRGIYPHFIELNARGKKEERVAQLAPFYRQGYIFHNRAVSAKLESQLCSFPRSELWDVMDATAYLIELMELDERYFLCEDSVGEDDYKDLQDEPDLSGDWRTI